MQEITRRAMSKLTEGVACGPVSDYAVDAEIVVEDGDNNVFLHAQWVDGIDEILFEATTESIYDIYQQFNQLDEEDTEETSEGEFERLLAERDRILSESNVETLMPDIDIYQRYGEQYKELLEMMQEILDRDEIDVDLSETELFGE